MRFLTELIGIYRGKDPQTQKFILAQILDQPYELNAADVARLLSREVESAEASVSRQARYSLGQYLGHHARRSFGLGPIDGPEAREAAIATPAEVTALARAASQLLAAPLEEVDRQGQGSRSLARHASLVEGSLVGPKTTARLSERVRGPSLNYAAAFALADMGGDAAFDALLEAVGRHGQEKPDAYMLLRGFPRPAALDLLARSEERTSTYGRVNIALALAHHAPDAAFDLLARLIRRGEGWVTAYALDTLAGFSAPASLALIREAYEANAQSFVGLLAVRAAGNIAGEEAMEFCLGCLKDGNDQIRWVALEALASRGVDPRRCLELTRPLIGSPVPHTRAQAILMVSELEPLSAGQALSTLVQSDDPDLRAQGAAVLGHFDGSGSAELLERMARADLSRHVRREAIRSLARLGPAEAFKRLSGLLSWPAEDVVARAARALTTLPLTQYFAVREALLAALATDTSPANRTILLVALGANEGRIGAPDQTVIDALVAGSRHADPGVQRGALDGLRFTGRQLDRADMDRLAANADPSIRAKTFRAAFLAGETDRIGMLVDQLSSGDKPRIVAAMKVLREIGHLVPSLPELTQFAALERRLRACAETPASGPIAAPSSGTFAPSPRSRAAVAAPLSRAFMASRELAVDPLAQVRYVPAHSRPERQRSASTALPAPPPPAKGWGAGEPWWPDFEDLAAHGRRALAVGLALVALTLAGRLWHRHRAAALPDAAARAPLARSDLRALSIRGTASRVRPGAPDAPLDPGDRLAIGDEVKLGSGNSRASLEDGAGNTMRLGPGSSIRLVAALPPPARKARYALVDVNGPCLLDYHLAAAADFRVGAATVRLARGAVELSETPSGTALAVTTGTAVVEQNEKRPVALGIGETYLLK